MLKLARESPFVISELDSDDDHLKGFGLGGGGVAAALSIHMTSSSAGAKEASSVICRVRGGGEE